MKAGVTSMKRSPPYMKSALEARASMMNMPEVGCAGNYYFATSQLNIAPMVPWGSSS
jgi:hypothetical protein